MLKDIPGHSGYQVTDEGRVFGPNGELKGTVRPDGYRSVNILGTMRLVQHLVLEAFVGPRPAGKLARHRSGVRDDNHLGNLLWSTQKENLGDTLEHGTRIQGSKQHLAKLDEHKVRLIVELSRSGQSDGAIATQFGVSRSTVSLIIEGRTWKHVTEGLL